MSNTNLPSVIDYSYDESDDQVVITCMDLSLPQDPPILPVDKDVIIYGNTITINGELKIPGKNLTINARQIISEGGSIDLSASSPG